MESIDGLDLWESLTKDRPSPRTEFLLNIDPKANSAGIRAGDWKLLYSKNLIFMYVKWVNKSDGSHINVQLDDVNKIFMKFVFLATLKYLAILLSYKNVRVLLKKIAPS